MEFKLRKINNNIDKLVFTNRIHNKINVFTKWDKKNGWFLNRFYLYLGER